ncbi:MAG: GreA/GreB family elongation factor [Elusimicrobia bacterium]|nr:GreA/GreB family elongation factor [Elusimicrobiota bacterium]
MCGNASTSITIVPHDAADPSAGKVSLAAPLAVALMGHRAGESVQIEVYGGIRTFHILRVIQGLTDPR